MRHSFILAIPIAGLAVLAFFSWPENQQRLVRYLVQQGVERRLEDPGPRQVQQAASFATGKVRRFPIPAAPSVETPAKSEPAPSAQTRVSISPSVETSAPPMRFTVQICASRSRTAARQLAGKLEKKGHDVAVSFADLPASGKWFRIQLGSYPNPQTAAVAAADLRRSHFPGAFVTQNEPAAGTVPTSTMAKAAGMVQASYATERAAVTTKAKIPADGTDRRTRLLIGAVQAVEAFDRSCQRISAGNKPRKMIADATGTARPPFPATDPNTESITTSPFPGGTLTARR